MTVWVLVETLVVGHIVRLSMDESTHKNELVGATTVGWMDDCGTYEGDEGRMLDDCKRGLSPVPRSNHE